MRPWKICTVCGEYKEHCAHDMCKDCYNREYRRKPINTESACYLGCNIAEKVLSKVFNDIEIMEPNNSGYDFICNKGKKIDVKSSCLREKKNRWVFNIKRNIIADFFLCIAFDNRESLTPLYLWLLSSSKVKDKRSIGISQKSIHKWDEFKLDISKTLQCCDQMKK